MSCEYVPIQLGDRELVDTLWPLYKRCACTVGGGRGGARAALLLGREWCTSRRAGGAALRLRKPAPAPAAAQRAAQPQAECLDIHQASR